MKSSDLFTRLLLGGSVLSALTVSGLLVRREFMPPPGPPSVQLAKADWANATAAGHRIGSDSAPVTIVEFADFECPACRYYTFGPLRAILRQYPGQVSVLFRHLTIPYHTQAIGAARAAECAAAQGHFAAMHDQLYAHQDSLNPNNYPHFAEKAGVPDIARFTACNASSDPVPALAADTTLARALKSHGTPTILIDGTMYPTPPDSARLDALVRKAIAKHS